MRTVSSGVQGHRGLRRCRQVLWWYACVYGHHVPRRSSDLCVCPLAYTTVTPEHLKLREEVLARKKPRKIFVQPHTKLEGDRVVLQVRNYERGGGRTQEGCRSVTWRLTGGLKWMGICRPSRPPPRA